MDASGIDLFAGVPDSLLQDLCACIEVNSAPERNLVTANEGNAVAIACGYHIATGKYAAVYLQNTGLGVAIDAFGSLVGPDVLDVPMPWIVGWRGHPELDDVPHHRWHGELTEVMCSQAGLEPVRVPRAAGALRRTVLAVCTKLTRLVPGIGCKERPIDCATTVALPVETRACCNVDGLPSTNSAS